jgi:hypothetical protein
MVFLEELELAKKFPALIVPEGSSQCPQMPTMGFYSELAYSSMSLNFLLVLSICYLFKVINSSGRYLYNCSSPSL